MHVTKWSSWTTERSSELAWTAFTECEIHEIELVQEASSPRSAHEFDTTWMKAGVELVAIKLYICMDSTSIHPVKPVYQSRYLYTAGGHSYRTQYPPFLSTSLYDPPGALGAACPGLTGPPNMDPHSLKTSLSGAQNCKWRNSKSGDRRLYTASRSLYGCYFCHLEVDGIWEYTWNGESQLRCVPSSLRDFTLENCGWGTVKSRMPHKRILGDSWGSATTRIQNPINLWTSMDTTDNQLNFGNIFDLRFELEKGLIKLL